MTAQDYNSCEQMQMMREKLLVQTKLLSRHDFQNQSNARHKDINFRVKRQSIPKHEDGQKAKGVSLYLRSLSSTHQEKQTTAGVVGRHIKVKNALNVIE
jgi:hypothetical protein